MVDPMQGEDPLAALWRMVDADAAFAGRKLPGLIAAIEARIAAQIVEVIHDPRFLALEAAWRGLDHLVASAEADPLAKIRVLHLTKRELAGDLNTPGAFEDSLLFARLYDDEIRTVGGEPYGALIGDYAFANHPDDLRLLGELAGIGATVLAPFVVAARPQLLGLEDFRGLAAAKRLSAVLATPQYAKWRALRDDADSRYLCLTLPRVLARLPYGKDGSPSGDLAIEEDTLRAALQHEERCWMSAAYVVGASLVRAFARDGWWPEVSGDDEAGLRTEVILTAAAAAELGVLGFLPVFHAAGADQPPSIGSRTVHKPKTYDRAQATADAAIAAQLPCLTTTSRFAQYAMVIVREKPGLESDYGGRWLSRWISTYSDAEARDQPLRGASVNVEKLPPQAGGGYAAVLRIRPRLANEELTTELRVATRLPGVPS